MREELFAFPQFGGCAIDVFGVDGVGVASIGADTGKVGDLTHVARYTAARQGKSREGLRREEGWLRVRTIFMATRDTQAVSLPDDPI